MTGYFQKKTFLTIILASTSLLLGLTGCEPAPVYTLLDGWTQEDVIALDPVDAPQPEGDLIALYHRWQGNDLQVRVDFLELGPVPDHDLYLAFDTGKFNIVDSLNEVEAEILRDLTVILPVDGEPRALGPDMRPLPNLIPRIVRDPALDAAVISLNLNAVPELKEPFRVMVTTTLPREVQLVDGIDPTASDTTPPPGAPLMLAFWNTMPAQSPAQALRRWQGAHTGPFGGRHGLRTLLDSSEQFQLPLLLLDVKNPTALSALDYLDQIDRVKSLAADELIHLPDSISLSSLAPLGQIAFLPAEQAIEENLRWSREVTGRFDLPTTQTLWAPWVPERIPSRYDLVILPAGGVMTGTQRIEDPVLPLTTGLLNLNGTHYLPLPAPGSDLQAQADGLALPTREALVEAAFLPEAWSRGGPALVILGGDLPLTSWGDPAYSEAAFRYISAHPWMNTLSAMDLLESADRQGIEADPSQVNFRRPILSDPVPYNIHGEPQISGLKISELQTNLIERTQSAPETLQTLLWDAFFTLLAPSSPESSDLPALRQGYLGQLGSFTAASGWAESPLPINDCSSDPDLDGEPECILASEELFLVFEPNGARLLFGALLDEGELLQWTGPYAQFENGLSDPSRWELNRGPAGDPGDLPGAFSDTDDRWMSYTYTQLPDGLRFTSDDGQRTKTFELGEFGLRVSYDVEEGPVKTLIPLVLSPLSRFTPGWRDLYSASTGPGSVTWSLDGGPRLSVESTAEISIIPFYEDEAQLVGPEDPNYDYPRGHINPFPIALVEASAEGNFSLEVLFSD